MDRFTYACCSCAADVMYLQLEERSSRRCDATILSLSWMGKVPDPLHTDSHGRLTLLHSTVSVYSSTVADLS